MNTSKKMLTAVAALAGLGAVAFGTTLAHPASAQVPPPPFSRPLGSDRDDRRGERHPELRRALRTLEQTETDLRRANRDFGGHRAKAADLCRRAEGEIQQALRYDRN